MGNTYNRSIAIVLEIVEIYFWRNIFQNLIFIFSFYSKNSRTGSRKTSITQELLVIESCPAPSWVTFLMFCWLVYDISSQLNDLILAWSDLLQVSHQKTGLVYQIFQFLNQTVTIIWYADRSSVYTEVFSSKTMRHVNQKCEWEWEWECQWHKQPI